MQHLFWGDYKVENLDLNDENIKRMVFLRILQNTKNPIKEFSKFDVKDVKNFLDTFKPTFNKDFLEKRAKVLRKVLFNEDVKVEELEWQ